MVNQTLCLRITNMSSLPDGGPLEVTATPDQILEVGRDSGIGWSLPDPRRFISGRHMEFRHEKGQWWLYDISTNGTFVNGSASRVKSPHPLQPGDRLQVGHYTVEASLHDGPGQQPSGAAPQADIWGAGIAASPPPQQPPPAEPAFQARPAVDIWGTGHVHPDPSPDPGEAVPVPPPAAQPLPGYGPGTTPPDGPAPGPAANPASGPGPAPSAAPPAAGGADPDMVLDAIATAAGLPEGSLSRGNPLETATEIGRALHAMSEELSALLQARAVARRSVRSGQVTMIGREDNNPLKFMPTADQALSAMFGPPRPGFQRGGEAIRAAFADVKRHQYATHAAIQPALARLLEDLAPETIEARVKSSGLLQNRRAKAWDTFVERWDAKAQSHENGMLDVFLAYFAEAYDQQNRQG